MFTNYIYHRLRRLRAMLTPHVLPARWELSYIQAWGGELRATLIEPALGPDSDDYYLQRHSYEDLEIHQQLNPLATIQDDPSDVQVMAHMHSLRLLDCYEQLANVPLTGAWCDFDAFDALERLVEVNLLTLEHIVTPILGVFLLTVYEMIGAYPESLVYNERLSEEQVQELICGEGAVEAWPKRQTVLYERFWRGVTQQPRLQMVATYLFASEVVPTSDIFPYGVTHLILSYDVVRNTRTALDRLRSNVTSMLM